MISEASPQTNHILDKIPGSAGAGIRHIVTVAFSLLEHFLRWTGGNITRARQGSALSSSIYISYLLVGETFLFQSYQSTLNTILASLKLTVVTKNKIGLKARMLKSTCWKAGGER